MTPLGHANQTPGERKIGFESTHMHTERSYKLGPKCRHFTVNVNNFRHLSLKIDFFDSEMSYDPVNVY